MPSKTKSFEDVVSTEPTLTELLKSIDLKGFRPKVNTSNEVVGLVINKQYINISVADVLPIEDCKQGAYKSYVINRSETTGKLWLNAPASEMAEGWT